MDIDLDALEKLAEVPGDNALTNDDLKQLIRMARAGAVPGISLTPVIIWLENGCNPKDAAQELRLLQAKFAAPTPPAIPKEAEPVDGQWYWVRREGIHDWVPAQRERKHWNSTRFSGIPLYEVEVGAALAAPRAEQPSLTGESDGLREAAQAVIDRWDSPLWKDLPHTAEFINRLRDALGEPLMLNGLTEAETSATMSVAGLSTLADSAGVGDALDAARYRRIRNGPHSDRHGDLYGMMFMPDGDDPITGAELDKACDAAIARADGSKT